MNDARFRFLAYNNKQTRKITSKGRNETGAWDIVMECGHTGQCVAHMVPGDTWQCMPCGEIYVRNAPQYAAEFEGDSK